MLDFDFRHFVFLLLNLVISTLFALTNWTLNRALTMLLLINRIWFATANLTAGGTVAPKQR